MLSNVVFGKFKTLTELWVTEFQFLDLFKKEIRGYVILSECGLLESLTITRS